MREKLYKNSVHYKISMFAVTLTLSLNQTLFSGIIKAKNTGVKEALLNRVPMMSAHSPPSYGAVPMDHLELGFLMFASMICLACPVVLIMECLVGALLPRKRVQRLPNGLVVLQWSHGSV